MALGTKRLSAKPTAPKTGYDIIYTKSDGLYMEDSNGIETQISGGTGPGGVQNNFGASVAPTVNDDSGDGYAVGSMWLDTTANNLYMAKSVGVGTASWMKISVKHTVTASTYPAVTDDVAAGYSIGSTWTLTASNVVFIARDVSSGAAVWRSIGTAYGVSNVAPTVNNDITQGYNVGSFWLDYAAFNYYVCTSVSTGAAKWYKVAVPCNLTATAAPGVGDDVGDGYAIGSVWFDTTNNNIYIAKSVSAGAAVWTKQAAHNNYAATGAPTVNDDIDLHYAPGSVWLDTTNHNMYICEVATNGAAVWKQVNTTALAGYIKADGTVPLTADWDVGAYKITANQLVSDVAEGTAPITVTSTTLCTNLNARYLNSFGSSSFIHADGDIALTADWDAGGYEIRALTFESDQTTVSGQAPFTVASQNVVTNLNADMVDGRNASATHGVYTIPVSSQYTGQIADDFVLNAGGDREQNRIGNYGAEIDTAGWAAYADAAGAAPVNGTGGSPTVTWTRTTTTPLRGDGAFILTKDAANRQGEGASYDFTIESSEKTAVFNIAFDYTVVSGTYATGDLTVYMYDVTNGVVIQPTSYQIATGTASMPLVFQGYFQAAADSTSYRLIFHVASTSSSAYVVQIDGVRVAVEPQTRGPIITDWVAWTPTGTWTANTTYTGYWRRVGDEMECRVKVLATGTPTTATLMVNLPPGYVIDTARTLDTAGANSAYGDSIVLDSGTDRYIGNVVYGTSTAVQFSVYPHAATYTGCNVVVTQAIPMTWTTNDDLVAWFKVPIAGWSSNMVMSSDADVRTVEASYYISGSTANAKITNAAQEILDFDTKLIDTHNAVTTGASWVFTAPISGYYIVTSTLRMAATTPAAASATVVNYIYVNGVLTSSAATIRANQTASSVNYSSQCTGIQYLNAKDTLQIYGLQSLAGGTTEVAIDTSGTYYNYVHIIRMGGPQTITPVETVAVRYQNSAATSISNAKEVAVPFASKVIDTHNSFNGATGVWTCPIAGTYLVEVTLTLLSGIAYAVDSTIVSRDGTSSELGRGLRTTTIASAYAIPNHLSYIYRFTAGQTMVMNIYQSNSNSSTLALEATTTSNHISIVRLGL